MPNTNPTIDRLVLAGVAQCRHQEESAARLFREAMETPGALAAMIDMDKWNATASHEAGDDDDNIDEMDFLSDTVATSDDDITATIEEMEREIIAGSQSSNFEEESEAEALEMALATLDAESDLDTDLDEEASLEELDEEIAALEASELDTDLEEDAALTDLDEEIAALEESALDTDLDEEASLEELDKEIAALEASDSDEEALSALEDNATSRLVANIRSL